MSPLPAASRAVPPHALQALQAEEAAHENVGQQPHPQVGTSPRDAAAADPSPLVPCRQKKQPMKVWCSSRTSREELDDMVKSWMRAPVTAGH